MSKNVVILLARYFLTDNVLEEVTFGWPRQKGDLQLKENLAMRLQKAINSVVAMFSCPPFSLIFTLCAGICSVCHDVEASLGSKLCQVGLNGISLDKSPHSLSGGYKRRLALAIQLVRSYTHANEYQFTYLLRSLNAFFLSSSLFFFV